MKCKGSFAGFLIGLIACVGIVIDSIGTVGDLIFAPKAITYSLLYLMLCMLCVYFLVKAYINPKACIWVIILGVLVFVVTFSRSSILSKGVFLLEELLFLIEVLLYIISGIISAVHYKKNKANMQDTDEVVIEKSVKATVVIMVVLYDLMIALVFFLSLGIFDATFAEMLYDNQLSCGTAFAGMLSAMLISFIPTIIYYFAFDSRLDTKGCVATFVCGVVISALNIWVTIKSNLWNHNAAIIDVLDESSWEQLFTLIVSHIALLMMYLLHFVNISADVIKARAESIKYEENDSFSQMARNVMKGVLKFAFKVVWTILKLKEKPHIYFPVLTIAFTFLSFFVSYIILAVIFILALALIFMVLSRLIEYSYGTVGSSYSSSSSERVYEVYDGYRKKTLKHYGYSTVEGAEEYIDNLGDHWYSKDNGYNFYKK